MTAHRTRDVLIVTNDFPPRQGGIQSFVFELAQRLPAERLAVYCSDYEGSREFDASLDYPVVRHPGGLLTPTPRARARVLDTVARFGTTKVWYGASAPLGLLAPALAEAGVKRQVATTHGHEVAWAMLPAGRQALRRIGNSVDVVTYLGEYTRHRMAAAFGPHTDLRQLTPGVDIDTFHPSVDGSEVRKRYGLTGRPVIVCVSRLVKRKGQDVLIEALARIRVQVPGAALLIVGKGPYENDLRKLAEDYGVGADVVITGGVPYSELPQHFAAGDVFAMPCRTRRFGMDVEGLGIVFLEASASGLPVVAGDSGGAPDAVERGRTGEVVDGRDIDAVASAISELLLDHSKAAAYGQAGRTWVEQNWRWDQMADRLASMLQL